MINAMLIVFYRMITSWYDIECTNASVEPFMPMSICARMRRAVSFTLGAYEKNLIIFEDSKMRGSSTSRMYRPFRHYELYGSSNIL
jgi:hypothetical protein